MDTRQLRTQLKKQRSALPADTVERTSLCIAEQLKNSIEFTQAKHIAYYLPVSGEADPTTLCFNRHKGLKQHKDFNENGAHKKSFYLPVLKKNGKIGLHFIKVDQATRFKKNRYGIAEPVFMTEDLIKPEKLDLVITPLVSFDLQGNRVGMGGGFYDRTFGFKQCNESTKPLLIGYAYEFQYSDNIIPEPWDVKLDGVVTEHRFTRC